MKRIFLAAAAVLTALVAPVAAAPFTTVERVGVYESSCSCTIPSLAVKVGYDKTEYVAVGERGLTQEIYFDEDLAVAWVMSEYGVKAKALRQPGGTHIDVDSGDVEHDGPSW